MATSSYDRVLENLMKLPATVELLGDLAAGYNRMELVKVVGNTSYSHRNQVEETHSRFHLKFNCPSGLQLHFSTSSAEETPSLMLVVFNRFSDKSAKKFEDAAQNVVDGVWKSKYCPTFNCKKDKVTERFIKRIKNDSMIPVDAAAWVESLSLLKQATEQDGSKQEAEAEALRLKAQTDILQAMKPFKNVPDDLIRQVIDQYILSRILEQ